MNNINFDIIKQIMSGSKFVSISNLKELHLDNNSNYELCDFLNNPKEKFNIKDVKIPSDPGVYVVKLRKYYKLKKRISYQC